MEDSEHKQLDIIIKVVGLVGLILSGAWTYYKYREDRRVDLQHQQEAVKLDEIARQKELNSFIFQKQTQLYLEASRAASTIAISSDPKAVKDAKERFKELFFGEMVTVEDRRVELAMVEFWRCMQLPPGQCERIGKIDTFPPVGPPIPSNLSLELSACIR
jgi:hypothetical protein